MNISKKTLKYCKLLEANNNRPWFHDNKEIYQEALENVKAFKEDLLAELSKIDAIEKEQKFSETYTILCNYCDFKELCLGIPQDTDPKSMTKDDVFEYARKKKGTKANKPSSKNNAFLNKLKSRNS